jgi:hypothetical protein
MQRSTAIATAALIIAALGWTPLSEAAKQLVIPKNSVTTAHIRNGTIQRVDLAKATIDYLTAGAPAPRARGVTVTPGTNGDRIRVSAPNLSGGNVLGQMEYLGGLSCPNLGPWLTVGATFFDANGLIVATGSDSETTPTANVRYPFEIFGAPAAVRAELVAEVVCF